MGAYSSTFLPPSPNKDVVKSPSMHIWIDKQIFLKSLFMKNQMELRLRLGRLALFGIIIGIGFGLILKSMVIGIFLGLPLAFIGGIIYRTLRT